MRILQLHSDFIEYEPVEKEIQQAEAVEKKKYRIDDVLVLFTSVEKGDDESVGSKAVDEVKSFLGNLKSNRILIYPFAHLSSSLARPMDALNVLKGMEKRAKELKIETYRAPFGWNKRLSIAVKGHPLAEQSKVFQAGNAKDEGKGTVSAALKAEEKLKSFWYIMKPSGDMVPVEEFDFKNYKNLEKFKNYEINKSRAYHQAPPHVVLMKRLEIAGNEAGSDSGNLRYYPKGRLIKSLLEQFVTQKVIEYGGMEVETPVMYDFQHPSLASYMNRFPARQYTITSDDKDFFLRFSACFGQFLMVHDAQISYKQLPLKIYELTRYSFRREKSGELVGLKRLRAFTMPDVHAMCADLEEAEKEQIVRCKLCIDTLDAFELGKEDYEMAVRFTKDFYDKNKKHITDLAKMIGKPVLVEMWNERFFYFILKWEFNFVDNLDKASALSTDQIDVENAERYGIAYVDGKGKKQHPIILHCSPSGAIERVMYAMLEKAYMDEKVGRVPHLPLWLSPTQVRVIPLSEKYLKDCEGIAEKIDAECIRVDVDDRNDTVQKKIRDAEMEWVNYSLVIGPKEMESTILSTRDRSKGKIRKMSLKELINEIKGMTKGKPYKSLSLPRLLSKRPIFTG
jgi:threonyl-tRNA synthetase